MTRSPGSWCLSRWVALAGRLTRRRTAQAGSTLEVVAIVDDGTGADGASGDVLGVPIVGGTDLVAAWRDDGRIDGVIVGIGDNHTRLAVAERLAGSVPGVVFCGMMINSLTCVVVP